MPDLQQDPTATGTPARLPGQGALTTIAGLLVVATLYFGRDIFVPFALAVLLGFLLDPLVTRLRRWGLSRGPAVIAVLLATVLTLGATSLFVGSQVVQLSKDLPTYQSTIQAKLRGLRQSLSERSALDSTTRMLEVLGGELDATRRAIDKAAHRAAPPLTRVQMEPAPQSAVKAAIDLIEPVLVPLGTAGIVLVFVIYILLERNDLRDRLIRLVGSNLHLTTDALGEAADRVSRYLTMQLLVNLSYGVPMAAGLALIGVPGALLWGVVAGIMRFVPYVGPVVAAAFPLTLAFAVDPGWQMMLWTAALVISLELISNNIVEPWLYGASTGLSPLSLILSAVFWTALWGPIGLVLATPLTVCLAVLGRHIPSLAWLDVLLGSQPVFDPPTRLYQRLLAGDVEEAIDMAGTQAAEGTVAGFYSDCAVPALRLAANDHRRVSSAEHRLRISTGVQALLQELRDDHPGRAVAGAGPAVLCIGARWELDAASAEMLAHALCLDGIDARTMPAGSVSAERLAGLDLAGVEQICLAYFSPDPEAHLRYVVRRLRRRKPGLRIVAALWNAPAALLAPDAAALLGVDAVAHSLAEARLCLQGEADSALGLEAAAAAAAAAAPGPAAQQAPTTAADPPEATPALRAAMTLTAQRLADVFDAPMAMVCWAEPACHILHTARHGPEPDPQGATDARQQQALVTWALALTLPQVVEDTARDPRMAALLAGPAAGLRFVASAPVRGRDHAVLGALCVLDSQPRQFSDRELRLLETMAVDLPVAAETPPHTAAAATDTAPPVPPLADPPLHAPA